MSLRTPLGKVRGLGSAKSGTHHWWMQKVTAIALIPLTVWFVASVVCLVTADYATAYNWLRSPLSAMLMTLFITVSLYHLKLGLQVVIEDYIHHEGLKIASLLAVSFACILVGLASVFSILQIAL